MKQIIIIIAVTFSTYTAFSQTRDSVYLCMGKMSHTYHNSAYCKGLDKCSTHLLKVSMSDAISTITGRFVAIAIDRSGENSEKKFPIKIHFKKV